MKANIVKESSQPIKLANGVPGIGWGVAIVKTTFPIQAGENTLGFGEENMGNV
jgi:hypothetical protein